MTDRAPTSPDQSNSSRTWLIVPLAIFATIVGLFAFALRSGDPSKLPSALIGRPAPQTVFAPLEGLQKNGAAVAGFSAQDLAKGEVSIVNFWASWCAPCAEEHPVLVDLAKSTGLKVYGVNYKDTPEAARRFLGRYGDPYERVGVDNNGRGAIEWGVYGMPETFVITPDGRVAYKHVGPLTPESVKAKMLPAIAKARTPPPATDAAAPAK